MMVWVQIMNNHTTIAGWAEFAAVKAISCFHVGDRFSANVIQITPLYCKWSKPGGVEVFSFRLQLEDANIKVSNI